MNRLRGPDPLGAAPATETCLALAERLVERAIAAGASQAEAVVVAEESALTRFANNEIHQNVAETNLSLNLRFVDGGRIGVASGDRAEDVALDILVERAARLARVVAENPDFRSLPDPGPLPPAGVGFSAATAGASPELRAEGARAVIAAAEGAGASAFGSYSTSSESIAIANSLGVRAAEPRSWAQLLTVVMAPDGGTGYAEQVARDVTSLDASAIGQEAADKAVRSRGPQSLEPGDYPVVLEEYAVVDLLDMLGYLGFSALAVQEDRSFFERGKRVGSDLVSIWDDGTDPAGLPMAFDYEGVGKQRVPLVTKGVCEEVVYDSLTAGREGRGSTGHALPAPNPWGPFPLNMMMAPGRASRQELVGGLERGLLVTRFHYTNPVHPKLAIVTGMTRDGTFLVGGGQVVGPVRNLRYTQSYVDALGAVEAVSQDRRLLRGFLGACLVPAVRIGAFRFTGATEH